MKIEIKYSGSILNLPAKVVDLASRASENELRVILGIFGFLPYFDSFDSCAKVLSKVKDMVYKPIEENRKAYNKLYCLYKELYYHFGKENDLMKRLIKIREEA